MDGVDWDLNAVVRGCRRKDQAAVDPFASFLSPLPEEKQQKKETEASMCFSTFTSWQRGEVEGLEELCKPFFCSAPPQQQNHLVSQRRDFPSPPSSSAVAAVGPAARVRQQQQQQQLSQLPRSKRRKNQQKKVVCHVPADGVSSDVWAWRKYGQKPIKGSPYPRGYYRCSSSKGCPARKQVERSRADPATFIITYTADHNHAVPSHRNSLAGSTRQKLPLAAAVEHPPSSSSTGLSPTTPLTASMEEEEEEDEEDEEELLVEDMEVIGEDDLLFVGDPQGDATAGPKAENCVDFFDGGDDGFDDRFFAPPSWLANSNAAAAAGGS